MKAYLFPLQWLLAGFLGLSVTQEGRAFLLLTPSPTGPPVTHQCAGGVCTCTTTLDPWAYVGSPGLGSLFHSRFTNSYPGWTIQYGSDAPGEGQITRYTAEVCSSFYSTAPATIDCIHGAWMDMWVEPSVAPPSGQDYHWIQYFVDSGGYCGYLTSPHDVIDHLAGLGPYYMAANEAAWRQPGQINNNGRFLFQDLPHAGCYFQGDQCGGPGACPVPCEWSVDVYTYLAVGTPGESATGTLTIYDGIKWGFTATCVPEPSVLALSALGAILLLGRFLKQSHGR